MRQLIVEVNGPPGMGKTHIANLIKECLEDAGLKTIIDESHTLQGLQKTIKDNDVTIIDN